MSFRRVLKNSSYILISQQLSRGINFLTVIILIRYLDKNTYGIWSIIQAIPSMFIVIAHMGIDSFVMRKIVYDKSIKEELIAKVLLLRLIFAGFFIGFVYIFAYAFNYEANVRQLVLISAISTSVICLTQVIASVFRASENFIFESVLQIVRSSALLLVVYVVMQFDLKLNGIVYGELILFIFITIVCYIWYKEKYSLKLKLFKFDSYAFLLKSSLPFALMALVDPIYMQIDIILLSQLSTFESVALYSLPYKIVLFMTTIPFSLTKTLFPNMARLYNTNKEAQIETFRRTCKIIALVGLPACVGIFLISDKLIYLLFSEQFAGAVLPLKIMSIMLLFYYFRQIFNVTLYASNMERSVGILFTVTIAIDIILDVILIPRWDYLGACIAALLSEMVFMGGSYFLITRGLFKIINIRDTKIIVKVILSVLVMGILVIISKKLPLPVQITVGILGYCSFVYIINIISAEEYRSFGKFIQLRK